MEVIGEKNFQYQVFNNSSSYWKLSKKNLQYLSKNYPKKNNFAHIFNIMPQNYKPYIQNKHYTCFNYLNYDIKRKDLFTPNISLTGVHLLFTNISVPLFS